jgi:hypothetical protein
VATQGKSYQNFALVSSCSASFININS